MDDKNFANLREQFRRKIGNGLIPEKQLSNLNLNERLSDYWLYKDTYEIDLQIYIPKELDFKTLLINFLSCQIMSSRQYD